MPLCTSCKEPETPGSTPDKPYIKLVVSKVDFNRLASSQKLDVDTNIADISCKSSADWCTAAWNNGSMAVSVKTNDASSSRSTVIFVEGGGVRLSVAVSQTGRSASVGSIKGDQSIPVLSASASSFQNGEGIEMSYDGDFSTIYHSSWSGTVMPVTLVYNFSNAGSMDYLVYNPRSNGVNGNFKEFDLYVTTSTQSETLYGSYDFGGSGSGSRVSFSPALQNPTRIKFVVKSAVSDTAGKDFASCAEMQFFRKNADGFDYSTIFTDMTCSGLKPGIGKTEIEQIENLFYRELATELLNGDYNTEFRVQNYRAWEHPDVMAAKNKTAKYSLLDNQTGIYVRKGEEIIAFAGELQGSSVSLFVQNPTANGISGSSYALSSGVNKFNASNDGLIYVMYHPRNLTGTEPQVKINIATGYVNGYFDSTKHSKERWTELLNGATFELFDLVGQYAHLTFRTSAFKQYTPDGKALIEKYDEMVRKEQEFMGLFKYDRVFKNRMYLKVMPAAWDGYMVASTYYTGYVASSQNLVLSLPSFTADSWGPAHEVGHINQTRPGFNWKGMAEVSNNVHSLYIQTEWGNRSRLMAAEGAYDSRYSKAFKEILEAKICYNAHSDVFCKLVPFWQLKLYIHDVLGKTDFYKDVYEAIRVNPNPATEGHCQIEFVKIACDAAKLDLTDFFEAWGFFTPISVEINDYGAAMFTITQSMADDAKAYIKSKGYPKPARNFERITDDTTAEYK